MHALEQVRKNCAQSGTALLLAGVREQPLEALREAGLLEAVGQANVARNIDEALRRAQEILGSKPAALTLRKRRGKKRRRAA
jgi:MFS superfamily sulfate permease-like transporter